ncbi:MAG: hypothetical protein V7K47_12220 [Nostoc sp.]
MVFKKFDSPYHAAIDRASRILSPGTIHKILAESYFGFQKLPPDIMAAACIIVCLHRICQSSTALFVFANCYKPIAENIIHRVPGHSNGQAYVKAVCGQTVSCEQASSLFTNCPECKEVWKQMLKPITIDRVDYE